MTRGRKRKPVPPSPPPLASGWNNRIVGQDEVAPDQLLAHPENWRIHPAEQQAVLEEILGRVGWVQRIIVNRATGHVLDGHLRVQLALRRNEPIVPVTYVELSDAEERLVLASIDPIAAMAKRDQEKLQALIAELPDAAALFEELFPKLGEARPDPDAVETAAQAANDAAVTRLGDRWCLGGSRLTCGDSADEGQVARAVDGAARVFLLMTDPPYGVSYGTKNFNPTAKSWAAIAGDADDPAALVERVLTVWLRHADPKLGIYCWSPSLAEGFRIHAGMLGAGLKVQGQIVWAKNAFALGQADYQWQHEVCWYGFRSKGEKHRWLGGRDQSTLWEVSRDPAAVYVHPTQKPVALFARAIANHLKTGDACFEPFCGSGSQLLAAHDRGVRCFAMELEPRYVDVAVLRWQEHAGEAARLGEVDGPTFAEVAAQRG